jgi:hypothetical protein
MGIYFMSKKRYIYVIFFLSIFTVSCSNLMPAEFWNDYQKENIHSENSDQGPWGGFREITWVSDSVNRFNSNDVINFAIKNGWTITDSLIISNKNAITPEIDLENYSDEVLKSKIESDIKWTRFSVYRFKTGWIKVEAGNIRETNKTGILAIKSDKTEMYVYHFWGE